MIFTDKKNSKSFVAVAELDKDTNKIVLYMTYHRRSQGIKPGYKSIKQEPSVFATHPVGQNQEDSAAVGISDLHGSSNQNLTSDSNAVNSDVILNEAVDDENLSPEQRALRERIKRGRAAQAQRRRRFYENIDAMLDKNMYVESDDLRRYRSNLERELRETYENDPGFKFTDDARYRRVFEEYHARDMRLFYHAKFPISSGKAERVNIIIKATRMKAYGYRDTEYFFLKIKLDSLRGPYRFKSPHNSIKTHFYMINIVIPDEFEFYFLYFLRFISLKLLDYMPGTRFL